MIPELQLDPRMKIWVLVPISIVMLLVGIIQQHIMVFIKSKVKTAPRTKISENQYINKAQLLLCNRGNLNNTSFTMRREYLSQVLSEGKYLALKSKSEEPQNVLSDPNTMELMTNMAVSNFANYIPQTIIMWWVDYFFAGFVLMKLPFPLTVRFKDMLQTGILTPDLDACWVSSISWYFISMFGLTPVYNLLLGSTEDDEAHQTYMQSQFVDSNMPGGPAPEAIMKNYANELTTAQHESSLDGVEERVLAIYSSIFKGE